MIYIEQGITGGQVGRALRNDDEELAEFLKELFEDGAEDADRLSDVTDYLNGADETANIVAGLRRLADIIEKET